MSLKKVWNFSKTLIEKERSKKVSLCHTHLGVGVVPRRLAFWSLISMSCWSWSISMMSGTARIRKVVSAIHATLPVLWRSFLDMTEASEATRLAWMTMDDWDTLRWCSCSLIWWCSCFFFSYRFDVHVLLFWVCSLILGLMSLRVYFWVWCSCF